MIGAVGAAALAQRAVLAARAAQLLVVRLRLRQVGAASRNDLAPRELASTAFLNMISASVSPNAGSNSPSGKWGNPSFDPATPINRSIWSYQGAMSA